MLGNVWGKCFCVHSFGESHGSAMGVVIDGCPAGVLFDQKLLDWSLQRRRPGQSALTSSRKEEDRPRVLSGVFEGKTLGTPIAIIVENQNQRSQDYDDIKRAPRLGHADDVWKSKFGHIDHRGGGRSSGRETVSRVMAGAVAEMLVRSLVSDIQVYGYGTQIGGIGLSKGFSRKESLEKLKNPRYEVDAFDSRLPEKEKAEQVRELLLKAKAEGKSYGGEVNLIIKGAPVGLGQPVFSKLKSDLAGAMMSVGATCSVKLGEGASAVQAEGSEFHASRGSASDDSHQYGGIRGGLSTGEDIILMVGFKPTSSVLDVAKAGRHDPCIVPRAIPVLEAMGWLVLADHLLWQRLDKL